VEVIPFALFKHCLLSFCFDLLGSSDLRVQHGSAYAVVRRGILLCFVSLLYCCFTAALLLLLLLLLGELGVVNWRDGLGHSVCL
jgi:hypothetical protein